MTLILISCLNDGISLRPHRPRPHRSHAHDCQRTDEVCSWNHPSAAERILFVDDARNPQHTEPIRLSHPFLDRTTLPLRGTAAI